MKQINLDNTPLMPWRNPSAFRGAALAAERIPEQPKSAPRLEGPGEPAADKADIQALSQDLRRDLARASFAVEAASQAIDMLLHGAAGDISELSTNVAEINGLIAGTILSPRQRQFSAGVAEWIGELATLTSKVPSLTQEVPVAPEADCGAESRRPLHLLVAEDNRINQRLAVDCLEAAGHSVDVVENGREAVDAVRGRRYDVVLMNVEMPALDGLDATAEIRALPEPAGQVPIIALTGCGASEGRSICKAAGMDDYMSKPFAPSALLAMVQKLGLGRPAAEA